MRDAVARAITEAARARDDVILVVADISPAAALKTFRRPDCLVIDGSVTVAAAADVSLTLHALPVSVTFAIFQLAKGEQATPLSTSPSLGLSVTRDVMFRLGSSTRPLPRKRLH